ncbi:MAG TPA: GAF and ANTAR domain-containing protein [Egibacteraceae bacterium]|nr:GAF and ANTAR domain-containing protein [Egibacteraceae bacterium]
MVDKDKLADLLIDFAGTLVADYEVDAKLSALCERICGVVPVSGAGVMLEDEDGDLRFVAASDEVVRAIEGLQIEFGEGPCLHAYMTGQQVVVPDLQASDWFPNFTPRAVAAGLIGVYSFPMAMGEERVGALNLYTGEIGEIGEDDSSAGQVLADIATTYILNARAFRESSRLSAQLQHALDSRVVIEQAKGRLAEQLGVSPQEAFEVMRSASRRDGVKLRTLAKQIAEGSLKLRA